MDQSVSKATYLGAVLAVLVTLAVAVSFTITLGRGMANDFTEATIDMLGIRGGTVKSMEDSIVTMSAASAQLLIAENLDRIDFDESELRVQLYGDSELTDLSSITAKTHGDVVVEVRRVSNNRVKIKVHRFDCNIRRFGGTCNCNSAH